VERDAGTLAIIAEFCEQPFGRMAMLDIEASRTGEDEKAMFLQLRQGTLGGALANVKRAL